MNIIFILFSNNDLKYGRQSYFVFEIHCSQLLSIHWAVLSIQWTLVYSCLFDYYVVSCTYLFIISLVLCISLLFFSSCKLVCGDSHLLITTNLNWSLTWNPFPNTINKIAVNAILHVQDNISNNNICTIININITASTNKILHFLHAHTTTHSNSYQ